MTVLDFHDKYARAETGALRRGQFLMNKLAQHHNQIPATLPLADVAEAIPVPSCLRSGELAKVVELRRWWA